jgi:hypothetical protein
MTEMMRKIMEKKYLGGWVGSKEEDGRKKKRKWVGKI